MRVRALLLLPIVTFTLLADRAAIGAVDDVMRAQRVTSPAKLVLGDLTASIEVPEGWSVENATLVPPAGLRESCTVKVERVLMPDFDNDLAAAMQRETLRAAHSVHRQLLRANDREAVGLRFVDKSGHRVSSIWVRADDGDPGDVLRWEVEGTNRKGGVECQLSFTAIAGSARITRL